MLVTIIRWDKCPICLGAKIVSWPPGHARDLPSTTSDSSGPWLCEACGQSGLLPVIEVKTP